MRAAASNGRQRLVVTADDFGISPGVNRGILEAARGGLVTTAAIMTNFEDFEASIAALSGAGNLDVAMHLNLTCGPPVARASRIPGLVGKNGDFQDLGALLVGTVLGRVGPEEVEHEWRAQLERGLAAGLRFSSLNSHRHVHMLPPFFRIATKLAGELRIPVVRRTRFPWRRGRGGSFVKRSAITLCTRTSLAFREDRVALGNDFAIELPPGPPERAAGALGRILRRLPAGVHELVCHPGYADRVLADRDSYVAGRASEIEVLVDGRVRRAVETADTVVVSYADLHAARAA